MAKQKGDTVRTYMYVQQLKYLPPHLSDKNKIKQYLDDNLPKGSQYAFIVHDKDYYLPEHEEAERKRLGTQWDDNRCNITESRDDYINNHLTVKAGAPREPHLHVSIYLPNTKTISAMASCIGDAQNRIEKFTGPNAKQNLFSYLVHKTEGSKLDGKYEYSFSEVVSNFDYEAYINGVSVAIASKKHDKDTIMQKVIKGDLRMIDFVMDDELMLFYLNNKTFVTSLIDSAYKRKMNENKKADSVKVIYIEGAAGSGKSTYARKYALEHYRDYCISSSHNDAVQDYLGQEVMIFDDARPGDFNASDWLKLLDPYNNNCSICSRYYNKYLAVKCIIITTTIPFEQFFVYAPKKESSNLAEPVSQFMRRFKNVIKATRAERGDILYTDLDIFTVQPCTKFQRKINDDYIDYTYRLSDKSAHVEIMIAPLHPHESEIDINEFEIH